MLSDVMLKVNAPMTKKKVLPQRNFEGHLDHFLKLDRCRIMQKLLKAKGSSLVSKLAKRNHTE